MLQSQSEGDLWKDCVNNGKKGHPIKREIGGMVSKPILGILPRLAGKSSTVQANVLRGSAYFKGSNELVRQALHMNIVFSIHWRAVVVPSFENH